MELIKKSDFVKARPHVHITPGDAVRILQELQELTQQQLSELTGISQSNISAIEKGHINLDREKTITLAKALQVNPLVILEFNKQNEIDQRIQDVQESKNLIKFTLEEFKKFDPSKKS